MKKQLLLKKVNELIKAWYSHNNDDEIVVAVKKLFDTYLIINQQDTEIWLAYALAMNIIAEGEEDSFNCLRSILHYDPNNIDALLLLVCLSFFYSHIDDYLFTELCSIKTNNSEILSMIEYMKIFYHTDRSIIEKNLIESIKLCDKHVYNFVTLGNLYINQGKIYEGKYLLKKGLDNVTLIYINFQIDTDPSLTVDEFFNEHIKGIHITDSNYNLILKDYYEANKASL